MTNPNPSKPERKQPTWRPLIYAAFTVSATARTSVQSYIANQEEHHKTNTFQDEFRRLLTEYEIEYDERYVWD